MLEGPLGVLSRILCRDETQRARGEDEAIVRRRQTHCDGQAKPAKSAASPELFSRPAPRSMSRPRALWVRLRNVSPLEMLRVEEALFRADKRTWFVTNSWDHGAASKPEGERERGAAGTSGAATSGAATSGAATSGAATSAAATSAAATSAAATSAAASRAVILGMSGKVSEMVHLERAQAASLPLIRRFTGGGTVVVDEQTLFVSVIAAADALPEVSPYPHPILEWNGQLVNEAIRACGAEGFRIRANDYCIGERKFGGNAQSISGKRWLHHTSVIWDYEPSRMAVLREPAKQPEYRERRSHGEVFFSHSSIFSHMSRPIIPISHREFCHDEFVRGLGAALPCRDGFSAALAEAVAQRFTLEEVGLEVVQEVMSTPHRQVTTLLDG